MSIESFLRDVKQSLADVLAESRVHRCGRRRAGARHRREYRDLLGGQRGYDLVPVPFQIRIGIVALQRARPRASMAADRQRSSCTGAKQATV